MKPILYALFAIILSFRTAFCSIYPTRPTSETIFVVGRTERLTWKDSRQRPYLNETSPCDIALYSNTTVKILTRSLSPNAFTGLRRYICYTSPSRCNESHPSSLPQSQLGLSNWHILVYTLLLFTFCCLISMQVYDSFAEA